MLLCSFILLQLKWLNKPSGIAEYFINSIKNKLYSNKSSLKNDVLPAVNGYSNSFDACYVSSPNNNFTSFWNKTTIRSNEF